VTVVTLYRRRGPFEHPIVPTPTVGKETSMNTLDRVKTAYRVVEDAAPGLVLGNDPASGFSILAHAALNNLRLMAPEKARSFVEGWTRTIEDTERNAVIAAR